MNIGVYVGSFSPVHKGHIGIVKFLLNKKILDKVIIIPTKEYWDKINLIAIEHRINMLKKYENDKVIINTDLNELPYTYLILNKLKEEYSKDNLYLIFGSDNLQSFSKWKNTEEMFKFKMIIINRGNYNSEKIIKENNFNRTKFLIVDNPNKYNYNSTEIREKIKNRKDVSKYLDKEVISYIKENNLYE